MDRTRDGAIRRAQACFDDGAFIDRLRTLVAVPTESHLPDHKADLERYCHVLGPMIAAMGFGTQVLDNPEPAHGPVLLATRMEGPGLPTVLFYGHGDVVRAMPERWRPGLDPWTLTVEGDRIYAAAWRTTRDSTCWGSRRCVVSVAARPFFLADN